MDESLVSLYSELVPRTPAGNHPIACSGKRVHTSIQKQSRTICIRNRVSMVKILIYTCMRILRADITTNQGSSEQSTVSVLLKRQVVHKSPIKRGQTRLTNSIRTFTAAPKVYAIIIANKNSTCTCTYTHTHTHTKINNN